MRFLQIPEYQNELEQHTKDYVPGYSGYVQKEDYHCEYLPCYNELWMNNSISGWTCLDPDLNIIYIHFPWSNASVGVN